MDAAQLRTDDSAEDGSDAKKRETRRQVSTCAKVTDKRRQGGYEYENSGQGSGSLGSCPAIV